MHLLCRDHRPSACLIVVRLANLLQPLQHTPQPSSLAPLHLRRTPSPILAGTGNIPSSTRPVDDTTSSSSATPSYNPRSGPDGCVEIKRARRTVCNQSRWRAVHGMLMRWWVAGLQVHDRRRRECRGVRGQDLVKHRMADGRLCIVSMEVG
jgi:hypothetical protein